MGTRQTLNVPSNGTLLIFASLRPRWMTFWSVLRVSREG